MERKTHKQPITMKYDKCYLEKNSKTRLLFLEGGGLPEARRRQWHPTPVLLPGKSHGRRSLVSCSPWRCEESDMTERLHFHFSLSCIGEGNGNPLQCSCLENSRDGGACGLLSVGSHRVGHDWSDLAAAALTYLSQSSLCLKKGSGDICLDGQNTSCMSLHSAASRF